MTTGRWRTGRYRQGALVVGLPGQDYNSLWVESPRRHLLLDRLTQADIAAFVPERLARGLGIDVAARLPRLHAHAMTLLEKRPFRVTEP
jgi:glutathione S-transferase